MSSCSRAQVGPVTVEANDAESPIPMPNSQGCIPIPKSAGKYDGPTAMETCHGKERNRLPGINSNFLIRPQVANMQLHLNGTLCAKTYIRNAEKIPFPAIELR